MLSVASFVLEVTFSPRGVDRADVVPVHHLGEVPILLRVLKRHKIHASLTTKVPAQIAKRRIIPSHQTQGDSPKSYWSQ